MKKAQGLSFNLIVLAIIALFLLIIIIAWSSGALGFLFGQTKTIAEVTDADITAAQTKCTQYCLQAQSARADTWASSTYCTKVMMSIDANEDGNITADEEVYCRSPLINTVCSATIGGEAVTEADC